MAKTDGVFPAIDANGISRSFKAEIDDATGQPVFTPYRKTDPTQQAAITDGLTAVVDAINALAGAGVSATVTPRDSALAAATPTSIFPGGTVVSVRFRNVGPNDAYYCVGDDAGPAFDPGSGNHQLNVGEYVQLPYRTDEPISFYSTLGTNIEAEEWS